MSIKVRVDGDPQAGFDVSIASGCVQRQYRTEAEVEAFLDGAKLMASAISDAAAVEVEDDRS